MSDVDTAAESDQASQIEATPNGLKDYYYTSLFICFAGVISCYAGYAVLQESLLSDKSKKMNTNLVMGVQSVFAVIISSAIIRVF